MGTLDVSLLLDIPYTNRFMFIHGCTEAPKHQAEARIPDSCARLCPLMCLPPRLCQRWDCG